ncbi:MAG: aldehyde dehydrogenase family protein [bacterium]|nr:aldehyde dehydrogenase family protein [bacterium]
MASTLKVHSPFDGKLIAEVQLKETDEIEAALEKAYRVLLDRSRWLKPFERIEILEKLVLLLERDKDSLIKTATLEGGKPWMDSKVEVERGIQGVKLAINEIHHLAGSEIPMGLTKSSINRLAFTIKEPIGVVAAVSAFNHPLNLIIHQVIPAVAVGAPVIIKPASATPLSCVNLINLLYEAGLPKDLAQVVVCKGSDAEKMVTDPRVNFFSFIGSAKVGWDLRSKLSPGTRCALEHGGAAPVIVEADADLKEALPLLTKGGFYHAGQVCVSVQRIFAHESIASTVARGIADLAKKLKVGDPLDPTTEVGPIINHTETDRIHTWVEEAKASGGEILCGGSKISNSLYQPTVIYNPSLSAKVSNSEIFGPVVCVYPYKNREDAINWANSLPLAFQASVFTKNLDIALDTLKRLNATAVMVNDHTAFRVDWMPFGGRDSSGLGLGGISYSMHEMTREKMAVIKSNVL